MFRRFMAQAAIAGLLGGMMPWAMADIVTQPIRFAKGASSATVKASIKGSQTIDYTLRARAGQTMNVTLKTSNGSNYFNVLPPGSNDVGIFVGSTSGDEFSSVLPADGEYKVRVYLMRNAARRNEHANYTLTVRITGASSGASGDAKVPGTPYHATGKVRCSMGDAPAGSQLCNFGVIRGQRGYAEVEITPPGGFKRVLIFDGAKVSVGGGGDDKLKTSQSGDTWNVEVNDYEHYLVPDGVINGG